jgi:RNA polymerase sigma factor (sigma-70 family)
VSDSRDDHDLVEGVRRGSEAAFTALYRRHAPRAYAVAVRMLGWRRTDADDVTQEAWLRAVRSMPGFRGASSFPTWLTGITIRCALERLRVRTRSAGSRPRVRTCATVDA